MRIRFSLALLIVVPVSAGIGWGITHALSGDSGRSKPAARTALAHQQGSRSAATTRTTLPAGASLTAVALQPQLAIHSAPNGTSAQRTLRNPTVTGAPLTLLVKSLDRDWLQAYLPTRPNGSLGWVPRQSVRLLMTPWSLTARLRSHRLIVTRAGSIVRTLPISVGQSVTPTPTGTYFITELLKQPDPTGVYGPYAFGLSAHSGVFRHFGRGGDGQIGIHGTDQSQLIGTNVSHGCIRLRNPDIIWLAQRLPLGTPVRITHT